MTEVDHPGELVAHLGKEIGVSDWVTVTEQMILQFGALTGDTNWIHFDPKRARREAPYGGVIGHGYLTLSFATAMSSQCLKINGAKRFLNGGLDRVRFITPVRPGARLRGRFVLKEVRVDAGQTRLVSECTMEIEGEAQPAMVAEIIKVVVADDPATAR